MKKIGLGILLFVNILFASEVYYQKVPPVGTSYKLVENYNAKSAYKIYLWSENNMAFIHFKPATGYDESDQICSSYIAPVQDGINKDIFLWYSSTEHLGCENISTATTFRIASAGNVSSLKVLDESKDFSFEFDLCCVDAILFNYVGTNKAFSNNVNSITKDTIDNLSSGWHLVGTSYSIYDLSIFSSAKVIWVYKNNSWAVYSSTNSNVANSGYSHINYIPAHSGIWVEK